MTEARVEVVVTGVTWMGHGIGSIESALERLIRGAERELAATTYSLSSGGNLVLDWLERALDRGVVASVVVNHIERRDDAKQPVPLRRLQDLARSYPHFRLYNFGTDDLDLHAKIVVADRRRALVGSSNLTRRGILTNHELGLVVEGGCAEQVAHAIDLLIASSAVSKYPAL